MIVWTGNFIHSEQLIKMKYIVVVTTLLMLLTCCVHKEYNEKECFNVNLECYNKTKTDRDGKDFIFCWVNDSLMFSGVDTKGGKDLTTIANSNGLPAKQYGQETIARAAIITTRSTEGHLGLHKGNSISVAVNAPSVALAHEFGHSLGIDDNYPNNIGGIMDYPPSGYVAPSEVDDIWTITKEKR